MSPGPARAGQLVLGLDADDTLWHNENHFADVETRFEDLCERWCERDAAAALREQMNRSNVSRYGYGAKAFGLSMIEAIIELSAGRATSADIATVIGWVKDLVDAPTVMIDGVAETLEQLSAERRCVIITKGDLYHQMARVDAANVERFAAHVEVVAEKDAASYRRVLKVLGIEPQDFVMVGNSLKSDVAPVLELGARAIHVPYHLTWALEVLDDKAVAALDHQRFVEVEAFTEVPAVLATWETA